MGSAARGSVDLRGRNDSGDICLRASAFLVVVALSLTLLSVTIIMPDTVAAYTPPPSRSVPSAPTELTATLGNAQVVLTWTAPSSSGGSQITNYKVYRGTISGGETFLLKLGKVLTYTDTGLTNGQTYFYTVSAVNAIGEGRQSNEASATPVTVPSAPLNLAATPGNGNVTLAWDPPASDGGTPILNYTVIRREGNGTYQPIAKLGNVRDFVDTGLTNGLTYYYKVTAINLVGEGPLSSEVSATPVAAPSAPLNLQATSGVAEVALNWSPPVDFGGSAITDYNIYRGTTSSGEGLLTTIGNQEVYADTSVTAGTTYYYRVSAVNAIGEGPQSNEASTTIPTEPSAPLNFQASAGDGQVNLTWSAPASNGGLSITNYKVYRGTSSGGETYLKNVTGASYNDTGLTNGKTYYYEVSAVNGVGEGALSLEVNATPKSGNTIPSPPQNLQASAGNGQVNLTWSASASDGGSAITNYKIYRGTVSDGESLLTTVGNVSLCTDTGLTNGQTYYYKVSAVNEIGESALSGEVSATPSPVPLKPSAPQHLQAASGNAQITLLWQAPSSNGSSAITEYRIYRGNSSGSEKYLTSVDGNNLTYTDTGLTNGQTYFYRVSAMNAAGEGPESDEASATPTSGNTPSPIQNLQISAGNAQVTLTWSAPANNGGSAITGYKIYRGTPSGAISYMTTITGTSYTDTGLTNGQTYYYHVSAVNGNGEGSLSNEISATPEIGGSSGGGGMDPMAFVSVVVIAIVMIAIISDVSILRRRTRK
jgi:fibronectin type 3 domain-containing protein